MNAEIPDTRWHYALFEKTDKIWLKKASQFVPYLNRTLISVYPRLALCNSLFVHDFIDERKMKSSPSALKRIIIKIISILLAKRLIFISKTSLREFTNFYPKLAKLVLKYKKHTVIYNSADSVFYSQKKSEYPDTGPTKILYYGAWKGYKNFGSGVRQLEDQPNIQLTIIENGIETDTALVNYLRSIFASVEFMRADSSLELLEAIDRHQAVLYTSKLEGFGIPLLESALRERWVIVDKHLNVRSEFDYGNQIVLSNNLPRELLKLKTKPTIKFDQKLPKSSLEWAEQVIEFSEK
ncbi:hypothetical protein N6L24_15440 [Cognatishimia sp. SS12]|nr:hypothetical protein [Cognatishimia sp. SS12]